MALAGCRPHRRLLPGLARPRHLRAPPSRDLCASGLVALERLPVARALSDRPARRRNREASMATFPLIDDSAASLEVRAVFDDIRATRKVDWINNFWRALANHPPTLRRIWQGLKEVMAPGALDPLTKELIYLAVSISNGCTYCTASHGAAAKRLGMTPEMVRQFLAGLRLAQHAKPLPGRD